jgi:hypothetical protein
VDIVWALVVLIPVSDIGVTNLDTGYRHEDPADCAEVALSLTKEADATEDRFDDTPLEEGPLDHNFRNRYVCIPVPGD